MTSVQFWPIHAIPSKKYLTLDPLPPPRPMGEGSVNIILLFKSRHFNQFLTKNLWRIESTSTPKGAGLER